MFVTKRAHGLRARLLMLGLPLVALLVFVAISEVRQRADEARRTETALARLATVAEAEGSLEWLAFSERRSGQEIQVRFDELRAEGERLLRQVNRDGGATRLAEELRSYEDAVGDKLGLLREGRDADAARVDLERVGPTFTLLHLTLEQEAARSREQADTASRHADVVTALALALGTVAFLLLIWQIDRVRRQLSSRREEELSRQALHDELTGLANRRQLLLRLGDEVARASADETPAALLLIDLNRFKEVNDGLGHHAGDELLRQVGPRFAPALPAGATLGRLGGDEFAALLPGCDAQAGARVASTLSARLDEPFTINALQVHVGASIGVASSPEHGDGVAALLRCADVAMYRAKSTRRDWEIYASEGDAHSRERLLLAAALRDAIASGDLSVHYQPKCDLRTDAITGVEALVRWPHRERGLLPPAELLPLAERTGLMRPLTLYVLERSLRQLVEWRRSGLDLSVAVNVSVLDLLDAGFPGNVERLLRESGVTPSRLQLEITEELVMADPVRTLDVLARLGEIGVGLSLDDFGTGHSSLANLKRLPVKELKIDRSFVQNVGNDGSDAAIVSATVSLAAALGLRVVAEGVETADAWARLASLGCDHAQGFYLSRPAPAGELTSWLLSRADRRGNGDAGAQDRHCAADSSREDGGT